ncbi:MAG: hypothetical protein IJM97_08160 [Clostridia bacterium]|nr:hypothetical protein [Clostridia bacterium]
MLNENIAKKKILKGMSIIALVCLILGIWVCENKIFAIIIGSIEVVLLAILCIPVFVKKVEESDLNIIKKLLVITSTTTLSFMLIGSNEAGKTIGKKVLVFAIALVVAFVFFLLLNLLVKKEPKDKDFSQKTAKKKSAISAMITAAVVMLLRHVFPNIVLYAPSLVAFGGALLFMVFFHVVFVTYKAKKSD